MPPDALSCIRGHILFLAKTLRLFVQEGVKRIATSRGCLAMTEEKTIPGKKNRETITEMLVRIVRRHCRPRKDSGCDEGAEEKPPLCKGDRRECLVLRWHSEAVTEGLCGSNPV